MITLGELKRNTGFKSFNEFSQNVLHSTSDTSDPTRTKYVYRQTLTGFLHGSFQVSFNMTKKELNKASQKEINHAHKSAEKNQVV